MAADGTGRFGLIVASPPQLLQTKGDVLDARQVQQIYTYQANYGVRAIMERPSAAAIVQDLPAQPSLGVTQMQNPALDF